MKGNLHIIIQPMAEKFLDKFDSANMAIFVLGF